MIKGVTEVISGYAGGKADSPTYEEVSSGSTGHAEAIQIKYDDKVVTYKDLLYIFLKTHDPTTRDQQGADMGTQYRSVIFYNTDEEKKLAEEAIIEAQKDYDSNIVTEVVKLGKFFKAEPIHQNYYKNNDDAMYCRVVIDPKIQKLKKDFGKYVKESN